MTLYQVSYRMFPEQPFQNWPEAQCAQDARGHNVVEGFFTQKAAEEKASEICRDGGEAVVVAVENVHPGRLGRPFPG